MIYKELQAKGWGKYPKEELVKWVIKNYGEVPGQYRHNVHFLDLDGKNGTFPFLIEEGFHAWSPQSKNFKDLHYPDGHFDAVIDVLSVCYSVDCKDIFTEICRVLKKGGRLFSMLPTFDSWQFPFENHDSVQFFTPELVRRCLNGKFEYSIGYSHTLDPSEAKGHVLRLWVVDAFKV